MRWIKTVTILFFRSVFACFMVFFFWDGSVGDHLGAAFGGGEFEIINAEAAAAFAPVAASLCGADHDGAVVFFLGAEIHADVGDLDLAAIGGGVGAGTRRRGRLG